MIRHSNGGRSTSNTVAVQLAKGLRFGVVASSDNHRGYPGAYGEGLLGVWANDLTREGLFDAIRKRRDYAWPGNVRELQHALERSIIMSDAQHLRPVHLPTMLV